MQVPPLPDDFLDWQIGHLLRRAYFVARRNSAAALSTLGDVSPVQAAALAALVDGPLTQAELGRRIDMEPANTHTLVRRLDAAGLTVTGRAAGNPRRVALTDAGHRMASRLAETLAVSAAATLAPLGETERGQLIAMLQRIAGIKPD